MNDSDSESKASTDYERSSREDVLLHPVVVVARPTLQSSFSPEFVISCVAMSLILQGFGLLPITLTALYIVEGVRDGSWQWQWLTVRMLEQWWRWLWASSIALLLMGIPMALVLIESKEYRDAPLLRKFSILCGRLFALVPQYRLTTPMVVVMGIGMVYLLLIAFGFVEPILLSEWILFLNTLVVGIAAFLSVITIPVGMVALIKFPLFLLQRPGYKSELSRRIGDIEQQLISLSELSSIPENSKQTTPVASKSTRSKVFDLRHRLEELKGLQASLWSPFWSNSTALLLYLIIMGVILWSLYILGSSFISFTWSNLFWYVPGVSLIDQLLMSSAIYLDLVQSPVKPLVNPNWSFVQIWTMNLVLCMSFILGLRRVFQSKRSVVPVTFQTTLKRLPLERILILIWMGLVGTVIATPLYFFIGSIDQVETSLFLARSPSPVDFASHSIKVLPLSLQALISSLCKPTVLGFPLLLWLVTIYRFILVTCSMIVTIRAIRDTFRFIPKELYNKRHID